MSEQTKVNVNGAVLIVLSVVLTAAVAFQAWTAQTVFAMSSQISSMRSELDRNKEEIKDIRDHGSPIIQAVMVRLDTLQAGQVRIEKTLEGVMKTVK